MIYRLYCPKCKHKTVHTSYDGYPAERKCPQCDTKYLEEDVMEMKELLGSRIADIDIKLLLYKTGLSQATDEEHKIKIQRFIQNLEAEREILAQEKILREAKEAKSNARRKNK